MTLNAIVLPSSPGTFMLLSGCYQILALAQETYTLIAQAKEGTGNSSNRLNSPLEKFALRYIGIVTDLIRAISNFNTLSTVFFQSIIRFQT